MNRLTLWVVALLGLAATAAATACEPIFPLAQLLAGSTALGPLAFIKSLCWLAVAVVIKSVAFAWFEKRLSWSQAALFMLIANVVSTIPGILVAGLAASGVGIVIALPIVSVLGSMVQRRLRRLPPSADRPRISGVVAFMAFLAVFVASMFLYILAGVVLHNHNYAGYWPLKFLVVSLLACSGIVISAVLEEWVISDLSTKTDRNLSFYTSVVRSNYVTLGLILLVAAVATLPERLRSPHFLLSCLEQVWTAIGLA